jgi:6-phosphogluconolactonase
MHMNLEILLNADAVARRGAEVIAESARQTVAARGKFVFAVSGGTTPWVMLKELAALEVPWGRVHIIQVDERAAPDGDPDRNLTHLRASLGSVALPAENLHPMPVTNPDLDAACRQYSDELAKLLGPSGSIDLCHLGLGPDGHTASLVPGDPVLEVMDRDVAATGVYQKRRRMSLTYPILNRSHSILFVVTGGNKVDALNKLKSADPSIPAGRILPRHMTILADRAAAGSPEPAA